MDKPAPRPPADRGQGRKPLARRITGLRVWVPVTTDHEIALINALPAAERRRRLLGEGAKPVYTFRYEPALVIGDEAHLVSNTGWRPLPASMVSEVERLMADGQGADCYIVYVFDADGHHAHPAEAIALRTDDGRTGIVWGTNEVWADSTPSIEDDIAAYLNGHGD